MMLLLVCAGIAILPARVQAQAHGDPTLALNILQQRVAFHLSGRVVDQDGAPLRDVRLDIDVHRFDPESLESPGQARVLELADGRFTIREDSATALQLRASKPGYLPARREIHYLEVLTARQAELERRIASGELKREVFEARRAHFFQDLRETNTNLVLVLEHLDGGPAFEPTVLPTLSVSSNQLESVCTLFPSGVEENAAPRQDLRLVLTPTVDGTWELALHAGPDGGVQPVGESPAERDRYLAPADGYLPSFTIPIPRRFTSVSFFLKTEEPYYARVDAHIARRPGPGACVLDVYHAVLQMDGSRALVPDPPPMKPTD